MHALLLLGPLLLPPAVTAGEPQAVVPESTLVARPVALPSYRLARAMRQEGPVEYSDAYGVRLQIHKLASYATVPLFVLQYLAGEELIEGEGGTLAGWHGGLAAGVAGLFAVNTITGGLNLLEARKDPEDRTRRTIHGLLMLAADAGFVATGVAANSAEEGEGGTHRTLALASMGVSLVSYAIMLPLFRKD
jgi:hypothetical protein